MVVLLSNIRVPPGADVVLGHYPQWVILSSSYTNTKQSRKTSRTDDLINIVIPSNNLNKGFIRLIKLRTFSFIKLRIFFASKSQGGGAH